MEFGNQTIHKSKRGQVVEITRLLEHFDKDSIHQFRTKLYSSIGVDNEQEFLCKILPNISKSLLRHESIESLKNETIKIAEKQKMALNNHITVYKSVQQSYNDKISQLPHSLIDHIASYLNKKQSILFGTLNRELYIESQSVNYLWKRYQCNDELKINNTKLDRVALNVSNPFNYCLPQRLHLGGVYGEELSQRHEHIVQSDWFLNHYLHD